MAGRAVFVRQLGILFCACMLGACAVATDEEPISSVDAAPGVPDASGVLFPDAPTGQPDAYVATYPDANTNIPDAYVPSPPDAAGSGLFCSTHTECTNPGECCFYLLEPPGFCVVGEVVLDICFPAE